MTTESLLVVIVLMAVGYIFIATVCWIIWSHDKDLHARIDAAAALRGEMAPLPPRAPKTPEEPAPEPAPAPVEVYTSEPEKPEEEPFSLDTGDTFLGYPCKLNPNLPKAPKYTFAWAKDRQVSADDLSKIFAVSDSAIKDYIHSQNIGITQKVGGRGNKYLCSFNSFFRVWLEQQKKQKNKKVYSFVILNERLTRITALYDRSFFESRVYSGYYSSYRPKRFTAPTIGLIKKRTIIYPSELYKFCKSNSFSEEYGKKLKKQFPYIKD